LLLVSIGSRDQKRLTNLGNAVALAVRYFQIGPASHPRTTNRRERSDYFFLVFVSCQLSLDKLRPILLRVLNRALQESGDQRSPLERRSTMACEEGAVRADGTHSALRLCAFADLLAVVFQ
jgi:hypothetical protein